MPFDFLYCLFVEPNCLSQYNSLPNIHIPCMAHKLPHVHIHSVADTEIFQAYWDGLLCCSKNGWYIWKFKLDDCLNLTKMDGTKHPFLDDCLNLITSSKNGWYKTSKIELLHSKGMFYRDQVEKPLLWEFMDRLVLHSQGKAFMLEGASHECQANVNFDVLTHWTYVFSPVAAQ